MPKHPWRLIAFAVAVVVVVVAATVAYFLLPPLQTAYVAVPPSDATPERVITAYLDALDDAT